LGQYRAEVRSLRRGRRALRFVVCRRDDAGDAVTYIEGFENGARANGVSDVSIVYTGSFSDVAAATETAQAHVDNGAVVLTGTSQSAIGAVNVAAANDVEELAVDDLTGQQLLHDRNCLIHHPTSGGLRRPERLELIDPVTNANLHDEPIGMYGSERPDVLGHQQRVPQRNEKQTTRRSIGPLGKQPTEHRRVLGVTSRHVVVVTDCH
jgi:hypothetical protein